jgi:hypothetical protein
MEFLSKIRNNMQKKVSRMPEGLPSLEEIQGNPRMPQMRMGDNATTYEDGRRRRSLYA